MTLSKHHIEDTEAVEEAKTELGKVNAAALAMIETRMNVIKAVLLRHEVAVLEVMCELHQQQQADTALLRQALEALEYYRSGEEHQPTPASEAIAALKERLI